MDEVIIVRHLTKKFGNSVVLDDINLVCEKGSIYGFIGRNGSGKTVLLKCICGLLMPSSGSIEVNGKTIGRQCDTPENIGILIESPGYLSAFSGYKNLKLLADLRKKITGSDVKNVMQKMGLDPNSKKHVKKYSMGMKQRLGIAQAIMEDPDILLLDEPMNSLDASGISEIRSLLKSLRDSGITLLLASHNMDDISSLCDYVYKIEDGKLVQYFPNPLPG